MRGLGEERKKGSGSSITAIIYYTCTKWNYDLTGFNPSNLLRDREKEVGM